MKNIIYACALFGSYEEFLYLCIMLEMDIGN